MTDQASAAPPLPLDARVSYLLSVLGTQSARSFANRLAPLGIQPNHFGLLVHLAHEDGQSQQQLANALGIHRNMMVGLIDELEERGLVERSRHPDDRRAHAIRLTTTARELLPRAHKLADEQEAELLAGFGDDDRACLLALLQRLASRGGGRPDVHPGMRHD